MNAPESLHKAGILDIAIRLRNNKFWSGGDFFSAATQLSLVTGRVTWLGRRRLANL